MTTRPTAINCGRFADPLQIMCLQFIIAGNGSGLSLGLASHRDARQPKAAKLINNGFPGFACLIGFSFFQSREMLQAATKLNRTLLTPFSRCLHSEKRFVLKWLRHSLFPHKKREWLTIPNNLLAITSSLLFANTPFSFTTGSVVQSLDLSTVSIDRITLANLNYCSITAARLKIQSISFARLGEFSLSRL